MNMTYHSSNMSFQDMVVICRRNRKYSARTRDFGNINSHHYPMLRPNKVVSQVNFVYNLDIGG